MTFPSVLHQQSLCHQSTNTNSSSPILHDRYFHHQPCNIIPSSIINISTITRHYQYFITNSLPSSLHHQPFIVNPSPSIFHLQPYTINPAPSTLYHHSFIIDSPPFSWNRRGTGSPKTAARTLAALPPLQPPSPPGPLHRHGQHSA